MKNSQIKYTDVINCKTYGVPTLELSNAKTLKIIQQSLLNLQYFGPLQQRKTSDSSNVLVVACILMLGGYPPIWIQLDWIQATLRAVRGCPICADPFDNTAITDERSCGKFIASNDWSVQHQSLNKPHLNTGHKLYTVSANEVTVSLCSMAFLSLVRSPMPPLPPRPAQRREVVEAEISCFHCG